MSSERRTAMLAVRVMGWSLGPNRFLMGNRKWIPCWRFQPELNLADAFRLLGKAEPERYSMGSERKGTFWARVEINGCIGEAKDILMPRAITFAIAKAMGIARQEAQL